ncbi:MAG: magnesium transporter CorA family protein [Gammaproteobacteria bacterium]|nr:magnesium transporter CorA family protein [Gammaproteobacteria bacterium]
MMQFMLCQNNACQLGGIELLEEWNNNGNSWIWVELFEEPVVKEQQFLLRHFAIDGLTVNEAQRDRHPPNFQAFEDYNYLLLKPLDTESDSLNFNTLQLAMFTGERFLVTRRSKASPDHTAIWQSLANNGSSGATPMSVMTSINKRVIKRYGTILLSLEHRLDVIEDELFDSPSDKLMKELVSYNTSLRKMHRILSYYVDVFATFRQQLHKQNHSQYNELDDIYSRIERFNSLSALYQNVITDLIEAYISLNGHRLNQIMKVLTIVTVIFIPLSLLVGIYGMNFEYIPELKTRNGYFILLGVMSTIAVLLLYLFRRVRWL